MCKDELKDKTIGDRWLRMNSRYKIISVDDGYVIQDSKTNTIISNIDGVDDLKWTTMQAAKEYLIVSLMLGELEE